MSVEEVVADDSQLATWDLLMGWVVRVYQTSLVVDRWNQSMSSSWWAAQMDQKGFLEKRRWPHLSSRHQIQIQGLEIRLAGGVVARAEL